MSIFDLSSDSADRLFGLSNWVLVIGAALVLIGTIAAIWTSGIRERYTDIRLSENETATSSANERSAAAAEGAAKANRAAGEAHERAAKLEKAASEALAGQQRVEIELAKAQEKTAKAETALVQIQRKQRWRLATTRFENSLKDRPVGVIEIYFPRGSEEAEQFAGSLFACLANTGWKCSYPKPAPDSKFSGITAQLPDGVPKPPKMATVASVLPNDGTLTVQLPTLEDLENRDKYPNGPLAVLLHALASDEIPSNLSFSSYLEAQVPKGAIRIVVGNKY